MLILIFYYLPTFFHVVKVKKIKKQNTMIKFIKNLIQKILNLFKKEKETGFPGCVPSPVDYRDVPLGSIQKEFRALPEEYKTPYVLRISHQGIKPHCVGYSCATMKEEKERREQNFMDFDGDWIYLECKKIDGAPNIKGTFFRAGLKVLKSKGAKPLEQNEDAAKFRIGGFARVSTDFESIKQAIMEYGVLLAGFRGSNEGWVNEHIKPPAPGERQWGHAVSLIGWNKDYIIGQNSWGAGWGDAGFFYIPKNYLPFEAWAVLVDLPNDWQDLINKGEKPIHNFAFNLYFGMVNDNIKPLQDCLKYEGCFPKETQSTGYFGMVTLESVRTFQRRYDIQPTSGYVGPLTRAKLNEIFSI